MNRSADSRAATELLVEFPHLTALDLRDNPVTLGFYLPAMQLLMAPAVGAATETETNAKGANATSMAMTVKQGSGAKRPAVAVDPFVLPDADVQRDELFASRLDETTRLRRRLHQVVFAGCCRRLRMLDGLPVRREVVLARDEVLKGLVEDGLLPAGLLGTGDSEDGRGGAKRPDGVGRWPAEEGSA
jgi:protein NUD1